MGRCLVESFTFEFAPHFSQRLNTNTNPTRHIPSGKEKKKPSNLLIKTIVIKELEL